MADVVKFAYRALLTRLIVHPSTLLRHQLLIQYRQLHSYLTSLIVSQHTQSFASASYEQLYPLICMT